MSISSERYRASLRRERLRGFFASGRTFGSGWHHFAANPPSSREDIARFENQWAILLPDDFKYFLTTEGNGAAGPYYGISPLQDWSQPWEESRFSSIFLSQSFEPTAAREAGLCPGAIRICNAGCEHYILLIVSGQHAGQVWHDAASDGLGAFPLLAPSGIPLSFTTWVEHWISALPSAQLEHEFWTAHDFKGHALAQVLADAQSPLATMASDQLPCPACIRKVSELRPLPRIVVTAEETAGIARNPKRSAILAARGTGSVSPRQIFPTKRALF